LSYNPVSHDVLEEILRSLLIHPFYRVIKTFEKPAKNAATPIAVGRKIIHSVKMTIRQKARLLFIVLWDAAKLPR